MWISRTVVSLVCFLSILNLVSCQLSAFDYGDYKKYLKKSQKKEIAKEKRKSTEDFVKKFEYDVTVKEGANALDFGLSPIDLNLLQDKEFAEDFVEGVEEELTVIDQEFGESENTSNQATKKSSKLASGSNAISLMHQGMYTPAPEYNLLIDGLIRNVQEDLKKRDMDPLYFGIHNRGVVRHAKDSAQEEWFHSPTKLNSDVGEGNDTIGSFNSSMPLGVGIIQGLQKLKRFGNAESRRDGNITLVRSHYFFGPLKIDMIFGSTKGIHILNSTLSSLAAHALIEVSNLDNSTSLAEFLTDSPMEYEIRLRGAKSRRFRQLSQTSITRLFKRGGRMETRLERSFKRALQKPIRSVTEKNTNKNKKNIDKENEKKGRTGRSLSLTP